ncbi:MAG: DNA-protecting protein DprA [Acidobacteria bacterium]|nr:DNA-protecting protein DprA [Acidobacteriota bacterium]MBI3262849.1 DNA-protecting protein DprA [Acidobacteriota bacterium]
MELFEEAVALSIAQVPRLRLAEALHAVRVARRDMLPGLEPVSLGAALEQAGYPDLADAVSGRIGDARTLLDKGARRNISAIAWNTQEYPSKLAEIFDPPPALWVQGTREWLERPTVAIVGSRSASQYALDVAERLARDLAARGVVVVSGMARGVDSAAHRGALEGGGSTVAVLGSGVDVIYPREHTRLSIAIRERGALVSELAPGTPALPHHFPLRNRLISGLSSALVVVEASERSGSLITARSALEQGREVMAVPGNVLSERNRGAHALLRDGACLVETADDVLRELGIVTRDRPKHAEDAAPDADPLLTAMTAGETYDLEVLAARSCLAGPALLAALSELELKGLVRRTVAGQFVRC